MPVHFTNIAVKSGNLVVIDKVEKMVTQTSTFMSNALINSKLGAAYCDWGATIRKIKAETSDRTAKITEVNKIKGDNPILNDFAEAQSLYEPNSGNRLQTFYSRLANPKAREKTLV